MGPSNRGVGGRQVALAFAQHGSTVYCMNALAVARDSNSGHNLKVVNNQLWALDLPSLVMRQVNDGPAGQVFGSLSSALPLTPFRRFNLAISARGNGELWAMSTEVADDGMFTTVSGTPICRLYRTPLGSVASLGALSLDCVLFRTPARFAAGDPLNRNNKQERTLPRIREFIRRHEGCFHSLAEQCYLPSIAEE